MIMNRIVVSRILFSIFTKNRMFQRHTNKRCSNGTIVHPPTDHLPSWHTKYKYFVHFSSPAGVPSAVLSLYLSNLHRHHFRVVRQMDVRSSYTKHEEARKFLKAGRSRRESVPNNELTTRKTVEGGRDRTRLPQIYDVYKMKPSRDSTIPRFNNISVREPAIAFLPSSAVSSSGENYVHTKITPKQHDALNIQHTHTLGTLVEASKT